LFSRVALEKKKGQPKGGEKGEGLFIILPIGKGGGDPEKGKKGGGHRILASIWL